MIEFLLTDGLRTFVFTWAFGLMWGLLSLAYHLWIGKEF